MSYNNGSELTRKLDALDHMPVEVLAGEQEFQGIVLKNNNGYKGNGKHNGKRNGNGHKNGATYILLRMTYAGAQGRARVMAAELPMHALSTDSVDIGDLCGTIMMNTTLSFEPYEARDEEVEKELRKLSV